MTGVYKTWHQWDPDGSDQRSVLAEIARHMRNAWEQRGNPGSTEFKAGHQLAHKGWKFGSGVVDLADGSGVAGIKALRALIIAGKHEWFERAAALAPGQTVTALQAPTELERNHLANLCGPFTPLARIDVTDAEIWMLPDAAGWRVAAVFVRDASADGLKQVMQLASATGGGCALAMWGFLVLLTVAVVAFKAAIHPYHSPAQDASDARGSHRRNLGTRPVPAPLSADVAR